MIEQPICLKTGCALVCPYHSTAETERWVWGDLHRIGKAYVFNAVLNFEGSAFWSYDPIPEFRRNASVRPAAYFERRGVIVFDSIQAFSGIDLNPPKG